MYIGVDIGGSKILVVAGSGRPAIKRQAKIETPETADQGVPEIIHLIEQVAADEPISSIMVAAPGPVDRKRGRLFDTPSNNLTWEPIDIVKRLTNHFRVPVGLEKDTNTAAVAEAEMGAGKGKPSVLYVTLSTGVGTGLVVSGEIYRGAHDPEAADMYIPTEPVVERLEAAASGKAIKRRFGLYGYQITDPKIWDVYAKDLAYGLHNLITVLMPDIVVIGGGVAVHFHKFEPFLLKHMSELRSAFPDPPIVPAANIETAVAYGSLILAQRLDKNGY